MIRNPKRTLGVRVGGKKKRTFCEGGMTNDWGEESERPSFSLTDTENSIIHRQSKVLRLKDSCDDWIQITMGISKTKTVRNRN